MGVKEEKWKRGTTVCRDCRYYAESSRTPAMRCCHVKNTRPSYLGTIYCQRPDHKNWDNKCELYERKD
jgi:hypothetical protein